VAEQQIGDRIGDALAAVVGAGQVFAGADAGPDYQHDESLTTTGRAPGWVVRPADAEQVAAVLALATEHGIPVTARGSGTGLCGACVPRADGILVSFERLDRVLEVDVANQVAVVQPGVSLSELDTALAAHGLHYPVAPGEHSASVGGTVGTNAGGMRAVRYGVTRHNVLGLQLALPTGELLRTGGKLMKVSTGYDLTQLVIGSEGTLALVTEVVLKLRPRPAHARTLLAPFPDLDQVIRAVPEIIATGRDPHILEYVDWLTMAAITHTSQLNLGIPDELRESAQAYLVVAVENNIESRLDDDVEALGTKLLELGALDAFVLDGAAARALIEAREHAFWTGKAAGAQDVIDTVVPRTAMPEFLARVRELAEAGGSYVVGCGHAGDGNVHLAVIQPDEQVRHTLLRDIFAAGLALGGAISGEHGIGTEKKPYFLELTDPATVALLRRIKAAFDPAGILNPDVLFDAN
jgi:glycolate oxidase